MHDIDGELRAIWSETLAQDSGPDVSGLPAGEVADGSDFFKQGGTSVAAVYLAARIQERIGVPVDAIEIVLNPTFGALRAIVGERAASSA